MPTMEFEIQGLPKTTNKLNVHWRVKQLNNKLWHRLVAEVVAISRYKPAAPLHKAVLFLTRCSTHCPDPDGLVASFKCVVDGLRYAGVLLDDKMSNIGMPTYNWEKAKRGEGKIKVKIQYKDEDMDREI